MTLFISSLRLCWLLALLVQSSSTCSPCFCKNVMANPPGSTKRVAIGKSVDCQHRLPGASAWSTKFPHETLEIDLSDNGISSVPKEALSQYSSLQKLNLSHNHITVVEEGAFLGLTNLVKLDLSNNKIGNINSTMFVGLTKLQKLLLPGNQIHSITSRDFLGVESLQSLDLAGNELKTVPEGTFKGLTNLKKLNLQSQYLVCDCHLKWIVRWSKLNSVRISDSTTCSVPHILRGKLLKRLKRRQLHCEWPIELPLFELKPKRSQVVFQGDKMPFECRASVIDPETKMLWIRHERLVTSNKSKGILVHTEVSRDQGIMVHSLLIASLETSYTGVWKCVVQTSRGNVSKTVNIIVYARDTRKCPSLTTRTNKGVFNWPKTISGVQASIPCPAGAASTYLGNAEAQATYSCNIQGQWEELDMRKCQYISEVTRVLEEYTLAPLNVSNVLKMAQRLKTYISNPRTIGDKIDLMYMSRILDRFSAFVQVHKQLSSLLYDVVSDMMEVDRDILYQSQVEDGACTRMTRLLERVPVQLLAQKKTVRIYANNIALEGRQVNAATFRGMACRASRLTNVKEKYNEKTFVCSENPIDNNITRSAASENTKGLAGLIDIPDTIFDQIDGDYERYRLLFILYKNSNLFPITSRSKSPVKSLVSSSVISCKVSESPVSNLSDPVIVSLQTSKDGPNLRSVFWDYTANDGKGDWSTQGCKIVTQFGNKSVAHCNHLTNFAILQDEVRPTPSSDMDSPWDSSRPQSSFLLQPVMYAGSGICILCLAATMLTYVSCFIHIRIPKKAKHSLINICLCILLLCVGYTLGINRIDQEVGCKIVGIGLHYFSISALFWITVSASIMYKKLTKTRSPQLPAVDSDNLQEAPPPKPVLGFYFLSYGVPVIICGITVAVSMDHYTRKEYCFLAWEPSLGAFYGPVSLLIVINCIFFTCIACVLRTTPQQPDPSEETEDLNPPTEIESATENIEAHLVRSSVHGSVLDLEYKPINQLRALVLLLFLFVVMWTAAAFAAAAPFRDIIPHMKTIFSYVYGVVSSMLGVFVLVYFCLARIDTRSSWRHAFCCEKREDYDVHTNTINLTSINGGVNNARNGNGQLVVRASSVESELSHKTDKTNQSISVVMNSRKESNINLVPSITEQSQHSGAEYVAQFYNPRQNGVARKFWQKHRKHNQLKLLNKELNTEKNINRNSEMHSDSPVSDRNTSVRFQGSAQVGAVEILDNHSVSDSLPDYRKHLNPEESVSESEPLPGSDPPPGYKSVICSSGSEKPSQLVQSYPPTRLSAERTIPANGSPALPIGFNGEYMRNDCFDYEVDQGMYAELSDQESSLMPVNSNNTRHACSPTLPSPPPPSDPPPPLEYERQSGPTKVGPDFGYKVPCILEHQRIPAMMDFNTEPLLTNYQPELNYRESRELSPFSHVGTSNTEIGASRAFRHSHSPDSDNPAGERAHLMHSSSESGTFSGSGLRQRNAGDFMNEIEQRIPSYGNRHFSPIRSDVADMRRHRGYRSGDSDSQSQSSINRRHPARSHCVDNYRQSGRSLDKPSNNRLSQDSSTSMKRDSCRSPDSGSQSETGHLRSHPNKSDRHKSQELGRPDNRLQSCDSGSQSDAKLRSNDSSYQSGSDHNKIMLSDGPSSNDRHHRKGKRSRKQRSLNWDDQFKDKPRKAIPYAFVNHKYQEKMAAKAHHHSAEDNSRPAKNDGRTFPRSISAYEHGIRGEYIDSDDSSSNESDDIWVPRRETKQFKHETSV